MARSRAGHAFGASVITQRAAQSGIVVRPEQGGIVGFPRLRITWPPTRMRYVANRILIVDDSQDFRAAAAELLAARGFELIEEAADGDEALSAAARACPDGILLDVNLPESDGFTLAASLASTCHRARIVLTSSEVERVPASVLRDCGARVFVPKEQLATTDLQELFAL